MGMFVVNPGHKYFCREDGCMVIKKEGDVVELNDNQAEKFSDCVTSVEDIETEKARKARLAAKAAEGKEVKDPKPDEKPSEPKKNEPKKNEPTTPAPTK